MKVEVNISTPDELRGLDLIDLLSLDRSITTPEGFTIKQNPYIVGVLCYEDYRRTQIIREYDVIITDDSVDTNIPRDIIYKTTKGLVVFKLGKDIDLTKVKEVIITVFI